MITISKEHISKTPGVCGGKACIAGHRIRVLDIFLMHERGGMMPDQIADEFPSITLADIHAALAYYFDHREEIEADMQRDREIAEKYRAMFPSKLALLRASHGKD
jgi:uncharacterized protein (DUF433 family)